MNSLAVISHRAAYSLKAQGFVFCCRQQQLYRPLYRPRPL
jgi:hypothetical protein